MQVTTTGSTAPGAPGAPPTPPPTSLAIKNVKQSSETPGDTSNPMGARAKSTKDSPSPLSKEKKKVTVHQPDSSNETSQSSLAITTQPLAINKPVAPSQASSTVSMQPVKRTAEESALFISDIKGREYKLATKLEESEWCCTSKAQCLDVTKDTALGLLCCCTCCCWVYIFKFLASDDCCLPNPDFDMSAKVKETSTALRVVTAHKLSGFRQIFGPDLSIKIHSMNFGERRFTDYGLSTYHTRTIQSAVALPACCLGALSGIVSSVATAFAQAGNAALAACAAPLVLPSAISAGALCTGGCFCYFCTGVLANHIITNAEAKYEGLLNLNSGATGKEKGAFGAQKVVLRKDNLNFGGKRNLDGLGEVEEEEATPIYPDNPDPSPDPTPKRGVLNFFTKEKKQDKKEETNSNSIFSKPTPDDEEKLIDEVSMTLGNDFMSLRAAKEAEKKKTKKK